MAKFLEKMRDPKDFVWKEEGLNLYDGFQYLLSNISEPFHLSWAYKQLVQHCRIYNEKPAEHIRQLLNQSNALGKISQPDPIYYPACLLFNNTQFILYPTKTEIEQGKLVLGDALRPYHTQGILFQELSFFDVSNLRLQTSTIPCSYKNLDTWFLHIKDLDEPILNGLLYDDNVPLSEEQRWKEEIEYQVPALEMSEMFASFKFQRGDGVVFTVRNYQKGEFEIRALKSSPRTYQIFCSKDYQSLIEEKVIEKIDQTGLSPFLYRALNDAYANMRHYGLFRNLMPLAWTRFLKRSKRLKVFSYNHDQFLYKGKLDRMSQMEIAQEFYCNFKRSENLNDLLEFYNSVLNEELVKAYAFQALRDNPLKKKDFFEQLFVRFPLDPFLPMIWVFFPILASFFGKRSRSLSL